MGFQGIPNLHHMLFGYCDPSETVLLALLLGPGLMPHAPSFREIDQVLLVVLRDAFRFFSAEVPDHADPTLAHIECFLKAFRSYPAKI